MGSSRPTSTTSNGPSPPHGCTSFVFHIPWTDAPQRAEVIDEPLDRLTDDPRVWCASPNDVAWWMIGHPADFPAVHHRDAPPAW